MRPLAATLALVVALLVPTAALAQTAPPSGGSPFGPLPPAQQAPPTTQPTPTPTPTQTSTTSTEADDPSNLGVLGLFAAGVLVIVAIGWFILRDARRSLPKRKRRRHSKQASATPPVSASGRRPPPRPPKKQHASRARANQRRSKRRAR
jgi:hypothetical protein